MLDKVANAFAITRVELEMEADIPGLDERAFQAIALEAKQNCPVSKALAGRNRDSSDCKAAHDRSRVIPGRFTQDYRYASRTHSAANFVRFLSDLVATRHRAYKTLSICQRLRQDVDLQRYVVSGLLADGEGSGSSRGLHVALLVRTLPSNRRSSFRRPG